MLNGIFNKNGSDYITTKINDAINNRTRTAIISGNWEITNAIRLPSNFTLILEDCHLRMADGVYSNMFVNENNDTEVGKTVNGANVNVNLIGRGKAILDGGKYNGLSEKTQLKNGLPPIWKNNLLLFTNVNGFKISNISCYNQRWWALNFIYCSNGIISNINFLASDIGIDENGNEYHGLKHDKYSEVLVKNADGIDLRQGCHDIVIENITGFTEDDSIALTGLNGNLEKTFAVKGLCKDIRNVEIKNIRSSAFCTIVRLLNQDGIKLHDVNINGVYDTSYDSPYMDKGLYAVRVGDTHLYGTTPATENDTYNVTIKNARGGGESVISLAGVIKNLVILDVEAFNGSKLIEDNR